MRAYSIFCVGAQQEISQDAGVRKYDDVTSENDRRPEEAAHAMRVAAKERTRNLIGKMAKLLAVANPANGPGFLEEVKSYATYFTTLHYLVYQFL